MNERIKQLAEQAGFDDRGSNHTAYMNFDHEKFAELIVGECINTVKLWEKDSRNHISYILERHFGVEE